VSKPNRQHPYIFGRVFFPGQEAKAIPDRILFQPLGNHVGNVVKLCKLWCQDDFPTPASRDREITFNFYTPTVFRQGKYDSALPTRECVFNSLLSRWNRYSNIPFLDLNLDCLFPSFFDLRTELMINPDGKCAGCVGAIAYRILGDVNPQTIKQINTLADFALYAGIGRKTTMGMGITRRIVKI
jgi:CRISPR-associated endoribonuclease Cas6